jgi:hypothetical protein
LNSRNNDTEIFSIAFLCGSGMLLKINHNDIEEKARSSLPDLPLSRKERIDFENDLR